MDARLLHAILEASEIGMILLDSDRRVLLWNPWMAQASQLAGEQAIGELIDELFPEIRGTRIDRAMTEAITSGMSSLLSSSLHKRLLPLTKEGRDGEREAMKQVTVIKPLQDDDARCCLIQVTDITAAVAREQVLRQQARTMQALAENYRLSEMHVRAIVENTADAIVTFDAKGAIETYNPGAEKVFGYVPREIVGKSIGILMPALGPQRDRDAGTVAQDFTDRRREMWGMRRDGTEFPIELSVSTMEVGGELLFISIAHDITERKKAEEEARNQREWLTTLINAMPDLVCFKDGEGRWLVANQFYLDLFDLSDVDYRGKTAVELAEFTWRYGDKLVDSLETDQQAWRESRVISYEWTVSLPDLSVKIFDMVKIPLFHLDGSRKGLVVVGRDVTDRKQAAARIQHLAHHDSLTDLPNRVLFQERLRQALAQAKRGGTMLAVLFLDLDKFKDVNDTLGHHVGDLLLQAVAARLVACVRETDTVARLGGDEFAVLLTNLESEVGASNVAESIIQGIAEPFAVDSNEIVTGASVGITVFPHDAQEADQLLKYADLALYRSKAEGRSSYHFYVAAMDAEVQARKAIERDLRHALGTEQLALFYQPLIDVRTGAVTGAEALIRWFHPERGFVPPGEFIPIVERTELIYPLGRWILEEACRQVRVWLDSGMPPLRVAVNLSPTQFKHQDLVAMVREVLRDTSVDPALLQLEITEGIAMHNVEATIDILQNLRDIGVEISIDDFGTGYSSLNYLKRFPVDKLKIDRSFVTDIGLHPDNAAIVRTIINLGHGIGTKVNVEGVETEEQLQFLRDHSVDEAQGFLFSRPLPAEEFARMITDGPWWLAEKESRKVSG